VSVGKVEIVFALETRLALMNGWSEPAREGGNA